MLPLSGPRIHRAIFTLLKWFNGRQPDLSLMTLQDFLVLPACLEYRMGHIGATVKSANLDYKIINHLVEVPHSHILVEAPAFTRSTTST